MSSWIADFIIIACLVGSIAGLSCCCNFDIARMQAAAVATTVVLVYCGVIHTHVQHTHTHTYLRRRQQQFSFVAKWVMSILSVRYSIQILIVFIEMTLKSFARFLVTSCGLFAHQLSFCCCRRCRCRGTFYSDFSFTLIVRLLLWVRFLVAQVCRKRQENWKQ